ncbi:GNAT family N-acetyltransferase [Arthrobacter caoxuetaonis]|uniref:GNAT family N-acetyltransferase n=1 Tax=Arthrobacter caoxuetaonis TaxID=2886935 RepID=A0A9X1SDM6_9MICC|nr:GNAT family N-acetyltransferase [Arthrobacter caoxuetaonis]MCC3283487.1 GNAT family N-acetyltransferase [Arthrobacter caoxuetaonis]MCC3298886.1 GNAT family N-acetyltransferase [Arthrobacter caoxuetaonis]USQ55768.1 GNAT family N-acetyltransferase [Arthrobacter caoxuetaonis]
MTAETAGTALRTERFAAGLSHADHQRVDERTADWLQAVNLGFHDPAWKPEQMASIVEAYRADGRMLTGVYDDAAPAYAWNPAAPVATYATMSNGLNAGGTLLQAHQITSVTVRPTHRRRGILNGMITADLLRAGEEGFAVAALLASEAVIYGRFGFGAATAEATVEVDARGRLELKVPPSGSTVLADAPKMEELAPEIFSRHLHAARGALGRQAGYAKRAAGLWGDVPEVQQDVRAAVHYDAAGTPDGYVTYRFLPWETEPHTLKVLDLVAVDDTARLELWRYLGSIDLVEKITASAPVADPLPWALADRRRYQVTGVEDTLWLRPLDPAAMLRARGFESDGTVVLTVADPLGIAAGRWLVQVDGTAVTVTELVPGEDGPSGVPAVEADAAAFGSLYLGGVSAQVLAVSGGVRGTEEGVAALDRLFAVARPPYCSTHF